MDDIISRKSSPSGSEKIPDNTFGSGDVRGESPVPSGGSAISVSGTTASPVKTRHAKRLLTKLGSFYVVALGVAFGAVAVFAALADEVLERDMEKLNTNALLTIHKYSSPLNDTIAVAITNFGSPPAVIGLGLLGAYVLFRRRRGIDAWTLVTVLAGGSLLSTLLKLVFAQIRPAVFAPLSHITSYSFPSGHTLMSFCLWGFLVVWLIGEKPGELWRWGVSLLALLLAALVGLSRMYIGVHWPTDVAAGFLLAVFWLAVCFTGRRWFLRRLTVKELTQVEASTPVAPKLDTK